MAFFSIFRHKPPVQFLTPLPEPEPQPTKFCKDCKHFGGFDNLECRKPEYSKYVDPVSGTPDYDYASVLRLKHKECGIEAHGWEPR